jgi:uncharacterized protein Yka (UPF0111/DUF47 family)
VKAVVVNSVQSMFEALNGANKQLASALRAVSATDNESVEAVLREAQSAGRWLDGAIRAARRLMGGGATRDNVNRLTARLEKIKGTANQAATLLTKASLEGTPRQLLDAALANLKGVLESVGAFNTKLQAIAK